MSYESLRSIKNVALHSEPVISRSMYNPANTFQNIFAWRSTVWSRLFCRVELYISLAVFAACVWYKSYAPQERLQMNPEVRASISALSTYMIFFLTFYNSQVYSRYQSQWTCTQIAYGRINDLNILVPAYMKKNPTARDTVVRLANAYHECVYMTDAALPTASIIHTLQHQMLLTDAETKQLSNQCQEGDSLGMRLLIWATSVVEESGIEPHYVVQVNEQLVLLRRSMAYLWSYDDQPVPFIYYNVMNVLLLVVLVLKTVDYASEVPLYDLSFEDLWVPQKSWYVFVEVLYVLILLALRELAIFFFDPFDEGEIPIARYMSLLAAGSSRLARYNDTPRDKGGHIEFHRAHTLQKIDGQDSSVDTAGRARVLQRMMHPGGDETSTRRATRRACL